MKRKTTQRQKRIAGTMLAVLVGIVVCFVCIPAEYEPEFSMQEQGAAAMTDKEDVPDWKTEVKAPELPIQFSDFGQISGYQCTETTESWRILSNESCADCALAVLETIHSHGLELVQAGFMDVSGESWGCVFTGSSGESLSVLMIPERPFSPRSENNLLIMNILHYFVPEDLA